MLFVVQESQFWKLFKEDPAACAVVMKTATGLVYLLACLLEPFMPSFTDEVSVHLFIICWKTISYNEAEGTYAVKLILGNRCFRLILVPYMKGDNTYSYQS